MAENMEQTFIMTKPYAIQRGMIGKIISRFERKGYKLVAMKLLTPSKDKMDNIYAEHVYQRWYNVYLDFMMSGPVCAMVWEGLNVVEESLKMLGNTNPIYAQPGTIIANYAIHTGRNLLHVSTSRKHAEREIKLFFSNEEIIRYNLTLSSWIYE